MDSREPPFWHSQTTGRSLNELFYSTPKPPPFPRETLQLTDWQYAPTVYGPYWHWNVSYWYTTSLDLKKLCWFQTLFIVDSKYKMYIQRSWDVTCVQCLSRQTLHTGAKAKSGWVAIWEGGRVAHFHRSRRKQIHVLSDGKKTGVCLVRFLLPWNMLKVEQICDLCHRRGKSTWLHYCQDDEIDHGIRGGWEWWRPVFRCCRTDFKLWHFFGGGEWHLN